MAADAIEDDLARRFRIDRPLTLLARKSSKAPIGFSHMRSSRPMGGCSLASPPEEAFAFHVPLEVPFFSNLWTSGRTREVPDWRLGYCWSCRSDCQGAGESDAAPQQRASSSGLTAATSSGRSSINSSARAAKTLNLARADSLYPCLARSRNYPMLQKS